LTLALRFAGTISPSFASLSAPSVSSFFLLLLSFFFLFSFVLARRRKSAMSSANLPLELDVFLDFISDDDRPTYVLKHSTTPKVFFRNAALDAIVTNTLQRTQFLSWIGTIHDMVGDQANRHARRVAKLGTFALRHWSCKRLEGPWIAVFSRQEDQVDNQWTARPSDRSADPEDLNPFKSLDGRKEDECPASTPVGQEALNKDSQQESTEYSQQQSEKDNQQDLDSVTTAEPSTMDILRGAQDTTGLLGDRTLDWLMFPHLTSDPWIQHLVRHDWSSTVVGPMHGWDPTLRQIYSTILSSEQPRAIYWGNDLRMLYNEAARFVVGEVHPEPLGNPLAKVWGASMFSHLTGILTSGTKRGKLFHHRAIELVPVRDGFSENCFSDCLPANFLLERSFHWCF
jgi:hypothetical protein